MTVQEWDAQYCSIGSQEIVSTAGGVSSDMRIA